MNDKSICGLEIAVASAGYDHVLTVPCSILHQWYLPSGAVRTIYLSREEEGVGIAVGLLAAGRQPLLMIQNSGLGNCINALGSLAFAYRVPLVIMVSLRGDELDDNPVQAPMGRATIHIINALECESTVVNRASDAESILIDMRKRAEHERRPKFILLPRRESLC
jgi:sulfopyruvate decarboxylase subunit alpha